MSNIRVIRAGYNAARSPVPLVDATGALTSEYARLLRKATSWLTPQVWMEYINPSEVEQRRGKLNSLLKAIANELRPAYKAAAALRDTQRSVIPLQPEMEGCTLSVVRIPAGTRIKEQLPGTVSTYYVLDGEIFFHNTPSPDGEENGRQVTLGDSGERVLLPAKNQPGLSLQSLGKMSVNDSHRLMTINEAIVIAAYARGNTGPTLPELLIQQARDLSAPRVLVAHPRHLTHTTTGVSNRLRVERPGTRAAKGLGPRGRRSR